MSKISGHAKNVSPFPGHNHIIGLTLNKVKGYIMEELPHPKSAYVNKTQPANDRTLKRPQLLPFTCSVLPIHEVHSPEPVQLREELISLKLHED